MSPFVRGANPVDEVNAVQFPHDKKALTRGLILAAVRGIEPLFGE